MKISKKGFGMTELKMTELKISQLKIKQEYRSLVSPLSSGFIMVNPSTSIYHFIASSRLGTLTAM